MFVISRIFGVLEYLVLGYLVLRVLCYLVYVTSTHTCSEVFSLDTFVQKNMMRFFAYISTLGRSHTCLYVL